METITEEAELEEKVPQVSPLPEIEKGKYIEAIGRRKRATARVRIWQNDSQKDFNILINNIGYKEYFKDIEFQKIVEAPLKKIRGQKAYKVTVQVKGGGKRGQAEAIRLGLSRALVLLNPEWKPKFKKAGFLTRDPREVERKKYGKRKARKREQWQKR
jgi:small subunit ribosomal protein S9